MSVCRRPGALSLRFSADSSLSALTSQLGCYFEFLKHLDITLRQPPVPRPFYNEPLVQPVGTWRGYFLLGDIDPRLQRLAPINRVNVFFFSAVPILKPVQHTELAIVELIDDSPDFAPRFRKNIRRAATGAGAIAA